MPRSPSASPRRAARKSRSRDRGKDREKKARSRSRNRSRDKSPAKRRRSPAKKSPARSQSRRRARSPSRRRSRSPSRRRRSRSRSRRATVRKRSRSPERVPPTDFSDYEPSSDGGGWYVYKKTGKWKYHPETGLYLHVKSKIYYHPKEGDAKGFRKIEDDDDPLVKKMKQSEEMRKAIQNTDFVQFGTGGPEGAPAPEGSAPTGTAADAVPVVAGPAAPPPEPVKAVEEKVEGKVQKWDSEKGFGFIMPLDTSSKNKDAGKSGEVQGVFVHRKNVVGSTATAPINLRDNCKVLYRVGEQDGRQCALEVVMLDNNGKALAIHAGAQSLEEKKKSYYVTSEALGVRVHAESWPGLKKQLQDRVACDEPMEELGLYFGVYDGHGGSQVAEHASKQLHKTILQNFRQKQVQPASRDEKIKQCVKEAFLHTDKEILGVSDRKQFQQVGSTAVTAMLHGNPKLGTPLRLVVANLGDSRAILCRAGQAVAVSEDHKPQRIDEKKRIERAGGLVLQVRGAWRVAASTNPTSMSKAARREYQGLAMTRSFGDLYFKQPVPLSVAEPEVKILPLSDKDLFLVLASDGITDVLTNEEVVDIAIKDWEDPQEAAKSIVRAAYKKGSEDNLTAMVIQFGWADKNVPKYLEKRKLGAKIMTVDGATTAAVPVKATEADSFDMFG